MDLLTIALSTYAPLQSAAINHMKGHLIRVLTDPYAMLDFDGDIVVTSDVGEESDDLLMIKYVLPKALCHKYVILSGGVFTPQERLDHLKKIFPNFKDAAFGSPFGTITFLEDGCVFDKDVKCFVNCGPCHSRTLDSIISCINKSSGRVITVGANDDGSAAGINQKQTDDGVLKFDKWNEYFAKLNPSVIKKNLSIDVSRFVLMPNPEGMSGEYGAMPQECKEDMVYTTAMFCASRPPPKFALRANVGNSYIDLQLFPDIMKYEGTSRFIYGLTLIQKYAAMCPNEEVAVSAAIPLMVTALMGGVYKEDVFGFGPTDKTARQNVACLTPESVPEFLDNIRKLKWRTPGYDLLAIILAQN